MINKCSICILGLGYIGLPSAVLLATRGYKVHGVDVNEETVRKINGEAHIYEPGLDACLKEAIKSGLFEACTKIVQSDVYMICVPTPFKNGEGSPEPDLNYIEAATNSVAPYVKAGDLVILGLPHQLVQRSWWNNCFLRVVLKQKKYQSLTALNVYCPAI